LLLRGSELKEAEAWLAAAGFEEPRATPLMLQFLWASRKAATVRQRLILGSVSFALLLVVCLALIAFYHYRVAQAEKIQVLHHRGLVFDERAEQAAQVKKWNEPRLYSFLALGHLTPGRDMIKQSQPYGRLIQQPQFPGSSLPLRLMF
jgi:hypothetical protein